MATIDCNELRRVHASCVFDTSKSEAFTLISPEVLAVLLEVDAVLAGVNLVELMDVRDVACEEPDAVEAREEDVDTVGTISFPKCPISTGEDRFVTVVGDLS